MPTWNPGQYLRFGDERTRPCRDLAFRIDVAPVRRIIDLGCGPGNSTAILASLWPDAQITGLDSSPEMIRTARSAMPNHQWTVGDISEWAGASKDSFDVVFSNAALQWVGNQDGAAHRLMRMIAGSAAWRDSFSTGVREWHVHDLDYYYDLLAKRAARL